MAQKKLQRFAELLNFTNVLQFPTDTSGNWNKHFGNYNPITLELACGKGEYTIGLARLYPDKNFIGIDLKGNRIWVGARTALKDNLSNVAFLRTQIEMLNQYFKGGEVESLWITFPDPQLRFSKAKKRLTHPKFLRVYKDILIPGGRINLKTDSPDLYQFTKLVIGLYDCIVHTDLDDIGPSLASNPELQIKTHYEGLDIAKSERIHYLSFSLPDSFAGIEKDSTLKQMLQDGEPE